MAINNLYEKGWTFREISMLRGEELKNRKSGTYIAHGEV
jgi:hypothetical protein